MESNITLYPTFSPTLSPTTYNSTSYGQTLHEEVWFAVRVIMVIGVWLIVLTLCYLRKKHREVEEGNIGSVGGKTYMDTHKEKRNVIHMKNRNKIIEMTDGEGLTEIELTDVKNITENDATYYI